MNGALTLSVFLSGYCGSSPPGSRMIRRCARLTLSEARRAIVSLNGSLDSKSNSRMLSQWTSEKYQFLSSLYQTELLYRQVRYSLLSK